MLTNKTIILGVSGGIAAYKIADLASELVKKGNQVHVIMTKNSTEFICPLTFETITKNKCILDTFDRSFEWEVNHISLAQKADVILVTPATANVMAKFASGIADDMLTTTMLATTCPKVIAPSMNTAMLENPITQENIEKLKKFGFSVVESDSGMLACGDQGKGRLPSKETLIDAIEMAVTPKDLQGKKVLVTAGATIEPIDPVRYITNHSTGKMGYAVARAAAFRGAEVTLISGSTNLVKPSYVKVIDVQSAEDMFGAVKSIYKEQDVFVKAAAVGDYKPSYSNQKIKKSHDEISVMLSKNTDILQFLGENKSGNQFVCGFSMETDNLIENSEKKLLKKNADMIIANNLNDLGAGFKNDTNAVTIITRKSKKTIDIIPKSELANIILDEITNN